MNVLGFSCFRVRGRSMIPAVCPGDYVVCWRFHRYRVGHLVVVEHPALGVIVKRILAHQIDAAGASTYRLSGDSPLSSSTEAIGAVGPNHLLGRVIWIAKPRD